MKIARRRGDIRDETLYFVSVRQEMDRYVQASVGARSEANRELLRLAYEGLIGNHMGVAKTRDRLV